MRADFGVSSPVDGLLRIRMILERSHRQITESTRLKRTQIVVQRLHRRSAPGLFRLSRTLAANNRMYIKAKTLDDLMRQVFELLLASTNLINPSKGKAWEEVGVLLEIENPRVRLSRTETRGKLFSSLGELLWYLAKTNNLEFIKYYIPTYENSSDDGKTIYGGYGPRLFNMRCNDQVTNVISLLKKRPDSRRAVIQLFDAADLAENHIDIPCTCTLQFMQRRSRLHMFVNMRSNDAFLGLPHDVFAFTMLQEIIARSVGAELGTYKHAVGSLHLYEENRERSKVYLDEGWQSTVPMPAMPKGDPWPSISVLLEAEAAIRSGKDIQISELGLDSYWDDLIRLLQIFACTKYGEIIKTEEIKNEMHSDIYKTYIEQRQAMKKPTITSSEQLPLIED